MCKQTAAHTHRHDYYMNELRIEFIEEWIELLLRHGFDPAVVSTAYSRQIWARQD